MTTTKNLYVEDSGSVQTDAELIAAASGTTVAKAELALEKAGGLVALVDLPVAGLMAIGFTPAMARRLYAWRQLEQRVDVRRTMRGVYDTPEAVGRHFCARLGHLEHEEMWVLALDGRNRARVIVRVAQGGRHGLAVLAPEILAPVLRVSASRFVLVHNHPSGDPTPSRPDVELTATITRAGAAVGTPMVDHVIVGGRYSWRSMREEGLIMGDTE